MAAGINRYKTDLRELFFVLFEQFGYGELTAKAPFDAWGPDTAKAVLEESYRFAREVLGPLNATGDKEGCRLENAEVKVPKGFKEAWKQLYEAGFPNLTIPTQHGGQGAPHSLYVLVKEMLAGANTAFDMYPALAYGAAEVIAEFGTAAQQERYLPGMISGAWGGTMCLTEAQAGSDVGAATTSAKKRPDGSYSIRGTKIFISGGDHDLTENIIHMVLARVEGAPTGTKGLSLFIVPKRRIDSAGTSGKLNDVSVPSIEHKMGINGSSTCVLTFGDNEECQGELVGTVENQGMAQMFKMMNSARIAVGIQGLAVAASAYYNALDYAKERKQGAHFTKWKDPSAPRVPILAHPDVRRMLLELKATTEGIRMLVVKLALHFDFAHALVGVDDEKAAYHRGQVELLTPLVKSYATDEAFRLCAQAIQVYGGAGFTRDYPVEQYTRDSKIFSIYEGTNHIQAMDLVGRKLGQAGGAHFQQFMGDVSAFIEAQRAHPVLGADVERLGAAQESIMQAAMTLFGWSQDGAKVHLVPLGANRFLTMMSQLAVGWLLLDGAVKAQEALASAGPTDKIFYEGKRYSAQWYSRNVLPLLETQAKVLLLEDSTPVEISDAAFATA